MSRESDKALIQSKFGTVFVHTQDEYKVACPVCGKKSLWINMAKMVYHCFVCGERGRAEKILGINNPIRAKKPSDLGQKNTQVKTKIPDVSLVLPVNYIRVLREQTFPAGWKYIRGRGVDPSLIEWGMYEHESVCFPMREDGDVVYWQSRLIVKSITRTKTQNPSKDVVHRGKDTVVYGIDEVKPGSVVVLVEGVFDKLRIKNSVALLGKNCSETQAMKILAKKPMAIVACFDPDTWIRPMGVARFVPSAVRASALFSRLDRTVPVLPVRWDGQDDVASLGNTATYRMIRDSVERPENVARLLSCGLSVQQLLKSLPD